MTIVKGLILCFATFLTTNMFAQQASLAGKYNTLADKSWIIGNPCIEIEGQPDADVVRFHVSFSGIEMYEGPYLKQDSCLNEKAIQMIYRLSIGRKIYFEDIVAYDAMGIPLRVPGFYIQLE